MASKVASTAVWVVAGGQFERVELGRRDEGFDGVRGVEDEVQVEGADGLLLAGVGFQREREELLEVRGGEALVVLEFQTLGAVGGDRDDLGGEEGGRFGVAAIASSPFFEQAGIDGLGFAPSS